MKLHKLHFRGQGQSIRSENMYVKMGTSTFKPYTIPQKHRLGNQSDNYWFSNLLVWMLDVRLCFYTECCTLAVKHTVSLRRNYTFQLITIFEVFSQCKVYGVGKIMSITWESWFFFKCRQSKQTTLEVLW